MLHSVTAQFTRSPRADKITPDASFHV